uniref:Uncharacterized threonine-rich GPI-anchored glycoprotein PJ4664.02-like n=1 Tax=Saccoglossus kowalevskii TaxID=10224 RepID=A0ABM0MHX6_SACKO|nr:PREDICTED: uncharacterized threonine-rich GPI-anchored glycoprotein PJ4664.02-like [Saccoglossus kowalevskii]
MGQALSKTHQDDETSSAFNDSVVSATHSDISFDSLNKQGKLKSKGNKIQFKPKSSLSGSYEVIDTPEKASSFGNLGNMSMSSSRMSSLNNSMTSCDEFEILNYEGSPKHYRTWRRQKNAAAQKNKEVGSKKDVCNTPVKPSDVSSGMDSFVLVDTPKVAEELQKYDTGQKIKDVATVEQGNGITVSHGKSGKSVVTNSRHGVGIDNGVSADKSMKARGVASTEKTKSNVSSVKVETTQSVKFSTVRETDLDVVIHNSPKPITTQSLCSSPASSQQPTPIDKYGKSSRRANSLDNRTRNTPSQIMDLSGQINVRDQKLAEKLNRSVPNVVASSSSFQKRTDSYVTPDEMKQKRKTASLYGTLPRKKAITGGVKATDLDAIEQLNLSPGAYTSKKSTDDQFNFPRSMRHFFLSPVSSHTSISWDTKDQPQSSLTPNYKGNKSLVTSSSIQSQSVAVSSSHVQTQPVAVTSTPVQNQSVAVKISPMQTQPVAVTRSPMQTQSLAATSSEVQSQPVAVTRSPMQTQSLAVTSLEVQSQPVAVTNSHVQSQPVAVTSSHVQSQSFAQSKVMNVSSNPVLKMNKDTRMYGRDGADSTENCNAARGGLPVRYLQTLVTKNESHIM